MWTSTKSSGSGIKGSIRGKSTKSAATHKQRANAHSTSGSNSDAGKRKRKKVAAKKIAARKVKQIKAAPKAALIQYRMSPIELRAIARDMLADMRQEDIAKMLMLAPRTMRRWLKGDAKIDGSSTALLRLLWAGRISVGDIRDALAGPGSAP